MTAPIGVAVIGTGAIAAAVEVTVGLELVAIGSRTRDSARAFIDRHSADGADAMSPREPWGRFSAIRAWGSFPSPPRSCWWPGRGSATPTGTHIDIGTRVLAAERHLLLE